MKSFSLLVLGLMVSTAGVAALVPDYDVGTPVLTELWVNPAGGSDANTGASRGQALATITEAWDRIPLTPSGAGYRINLVAGTYPLASIPLWLEGYTGTRDYPIIMRAVDGRGTAVLQNVLNLFDCAFVYFIDFSVIPPEPLGADVIHFAGSSDILLRGLTLDGSGNSGREAQEGLKMNQCQRVYVEECDISGGFDNGLDFVAVQYGHILRNRIHNAEDWCMYVKGGSAYFVVEGNEFHDSSNGGFAAGQGTTFDYMVAPWIHYEAYDVKFVNNVVHHTQGAGFGVHGGYNILIAHNTVYHCGANSHLAEVYYGNRIVADYAVANPLIAMGGWAPARGVFELFIPCRNVFIYNNLLYNPPGFQTAYTHFTVNTPQHPTVGAGVADDNLQIRGNVVWNGPSDWPVGVGGGSCDEGHTTCSESAILANNWINSVEPELVNPAGRNFRPVDEGTLAGIHAAAIPSFPGGDQAAPPLAPAGDLDNLVPDDRAGTERLAGSTPGAYTIGGSSGEGEGEGEGDGCAGGTMAGGGNPPAGTVLVLGLSTAVLALARRRVQPV